LKGEKKGEGLNGRGRCQQNKEQKRSPVKIVERALSRPHWHIGGKESGKRAQRLGCAIRGQKATTVFRPKLGGGKGELGRSGRVNRFYSID